MISLICSSQLQPFKACRFFSRTFVGNTVNGICVIKNRVNANVLCLWLVITHPHEMVITIQVGGISQLGNPVRGIRIETCGTHS
jgi:hypothetical protein